MADRPGPSADTQAWLSVFRRACDRVADEVARMAPERRAEPCGRGAGGDVTVLVDRVAEDIVVEELERLGRPLTLVSEELGERDLAGGGPPLLVVDPIDGSLNAKRGMPLFATSIAIADGRRMADVRAGLVRDHGTGEEFVAERGRGAWMDGRPLRAPTGSRDGVMELLMLEGARPARVVRAAKALDGRVGRLRAIGSLALSICHTAAGRADAMVGLGPGRAVDIAAAQLVARESGLIVGLPEPGDLDGAPLDVTTLSHVVTARDHATLELLAGLLPRRR
jgi:myo-inositol-1(or 4)-monophosphatase